MKPKLSMYLEQIAADLEAGADRQRQHATFLRRVAAGLKTNSAGTNAEEKPNQPAGTNPGRK